jgi:hypothetical protein
VEAKTKQTLFITKTRKNENTKKKNITKFRAFQLSEIDSPPAPLRSLKSQSSQSEFFFSLSAEPR